jgi:hypothetical protein
LWYAQQQKEIKGLIATVKEQAAPQVVNNP